MQPYEPDPLPLTALDWRRLLPLVGQANAALARYDGLLQGIPNPAVMLSPLTHQEAVLSSRIEGTQATVEEVLEHEAGGEIALLPVHRAADQVKHRTTVDEKGATGGLDPLVHRIGFADVVD